MFGLAILTQTKLSFLPRPPARRWLPGGGKTPDEIITPEINAVVFIHLLLKHHRLKSGNTHTRENIYVSL
jgi:hypothetical protein